MRPFPKPLFAPLLPALGLLVACTQPAGAAPEAAPAAVSAPVAAEGDAPGSIVGEWNPDASLCNDSRMTFTADGRHEALMDDGDGWQVLASGRYEQDGANLVIRFEGEVQQREIVSVGAQALVLRHDDTALAKVTGGYEVTLHRCPGRGEGRLTRRAGLREAAADPEVGGGSGGKARHYALEKVVAREELPGFSRR